MANYGEDYNAAEADASNVSADDAVPDEEFFETRGLAGLTRFRKNSRVVVVDRVRELPGMHAGLHLAFVIATGKTDFDLLWPGVLDIYFEP